MQNSLNQLAPQLREFKTGIFQQVNCNDSFSNCYVSAAIKVTSDIQVSTHSVSLVISSWITLAECVEIILEIAAHCRYGTLISWWVRFQWWLYCAGNSPHWGKVWLWVHSLYWTLNYDPEGTDGNWRKHSRRSAELGFAREGNPAYFAKNWSQADNMFGRRKSLLEIRFSRENHPLERVPFLVERHVSKQNYWSDHNPQVFDINSNTKILVWFDLWDGGIMGPFFFRNEERDTVAINCHHRVMLSDFPGLELDDADISGLSFLQDGARWHKRCNVQNCVGKTWRLGHLAGSVYQLAAAIMQLDTPQLFSLWFAVVSQSFWRDRI